MRQKHVNQERSPVTLMVWSLVIGPILLVNSGCSVVMATKQPHKKNLTVLDEGTPRNIVIAELGAPIVHIPGTTDPSSPAGSAGDLFLDTDLGGAQGTLRGKGTDGVWATVHDFNLA